MGAVSKPRYVRFFVERLQGTILHEHWRVEFRRHYFTALLHESELARTDPDPQFLHRPMRYDIGLPSPVI